MPQEIQKLKQHYEFTEADVANLRKVGEALLTEADAFVEAFYSRIAHYPEAQLHLQEPARLVHYKQQIRQWYEELFTSAYDATYFAHLQHIGETHVRIGLPTHHVNAAINFVRRFINSQIQKHFPSESAPIDLIGSCGKMLDMNLDVLTSAYHEEQMIPYSTLSKFKLRLITLAKKVSDLADLVLVLALMLVGPFVVGLFAYDVYLLVTGAVKMEEGILMVLGSLLILWAVSELMEEEVRHLRGEGFAIAAFLSLAMAAMIRKILITSLSGDKVVELLSYGGLVLALGLVYWLIVKNDIRIGGRKANKS